MKFTKMHGCGNDYVYVNCFEETVKNPSETAKQVSDRHFGIGSDGLILICPSDKADFRMAMYNMDGSEGKMCGNGVRCIAKYVYDHHLTDKTRISLETLGGIKYLDLNIKDGKVNTVTVDMERTLEGIRRLAPESMTVHSLAVKRASRLNQNLELYPPAQQEEVNQMINMAWHEAEAMGMEPYYLYRQKNMAGNFENVGYAAPDKACIYNILIMEEKQTIVACGAGTTTKVVFPAENRLERVENVKDVDQYIARIDEMIGRKEKMLEKLDGLS